MKAKLIITCEFNTESLDWSEPQALDIVDAYNQYYEQDDNAHEAFEIALKDPNFRVVSARIRRI